MESHLSEESLWASGLASRLRLIQANFADDPSKERQGYVIEEIERALKPVSPTRRRAYLEALAERFPAWEGARSAPSSDTKVGPTPLTPEELVARLVEIAPSLSGEARNDFANQLHAAGLGVKEQASGFLEVPPELQKKLGLPPGKPLQVERAVKLLVITAELALALDQLAWALWKQLAPKSAIRRETELNRLAASYLTGDAEVSTAQLAQPVEKTRRLIAGLLGSVGRAGSAYAKKYVASLSPEVIEDWAKMDKKWNESLEAACWRKFLQQSKEHASEPAIEHEMQEAIAKAAENLILGPRFRLNQANMSEKIHWQEGLFLQPHHLQRMQKSLGDDLASERRLAWAYPYGVIEARLSRDELENKRVRFDKLRVIMPSGVEVNFPAAAELPSLDIAQAFAKGAGSFTVLLGVPLWQNSRANTVPLTHDADTRAKLLYRVGEIECHDENSGENPKPVQIRKINSRLMFEHEDASDMEVLPLLRIVRATGEDLGMPKEDPEYVPSCMLLSGSTALRDLVRELVSQVEATRKELVDRVIRGGFTFDSMRGAQFEQLMRLRTLNRYSGRLPSLIHAPAVTPFEIYLELRELLGDLAALQLGRDQFECSAYRHDHQFLCFRELSNRIRDLLAGSAPPSYLKLAFKEAGGILTASFSEEHLTLPNAYYLAIKTKVDPTALVKFVEDGDKFKLMPLSLATRAIRGIELKEERVAPMGLPAGVDLHYFRLERANSARMWQQIQTEKTAAIRWTGGEIDWSDAGFTLYMTVPAGAQKP